MEDCLSKFVLPGKKTNDVLRGGHAEGLLLGQRKKSLETGFLFLVGFFRVISCQ